MNIEQEARDLLRGSSALSPEDAHLTRREYPALDAACRAIEARDEVQAAFDAYRREVSEALRDALPWTAHGKSISAQQRHRLSRFIIPEPVDPLTDTLNELGVDRADFDAVLAKIGGKVVFGELT